MVVVTLRLIQKIKNGENLDTWNKLEKIDKKFDEHKARLGYPNNKKRLRCLFGSYDSNTIIIETQWTSLGKLDRTLTKSFLDPEYQKLNKEIEPILESTIMEIYTPVISIQDLEKAKDKD